MAFMGATGSGHETCHTLDIQATRYVQARHMPEPDVRFENFDHRRDILVGKHGANTDHLPAGRQIGQVLRQGARRLRAA